MSPGNFTVENIGSQPPCFWRVYFYSKQNATSKVHPLEDLQSLPLHLSNHWPRPLQPWQGNPRYDWAMACRCVATSLGRNDAFLPVKKKTSDSSEGEKKRASSHDVHIAIYLHEHMYTVYMCKSYICKHIMYICMGELHLILQYFTNFQTPKVSRNRSYLSTKPKRLSQGFPAHSHLADRSQCSSKAWKVESQDVFFLSSTNILLRTNFTASGAIGQVSNKNQ